jgi:hypothetical protein
MTTLSPSVKPVILTAPPGWGKTRNAEALRTELGCASVVDNWNPHTGYLTADTLHLTNAPPREVIEAGRVAATLVSRGWD